MPVVRSRLGFSYQLQPPPQAMYGLTAWGADKYKTLTVRPSCVCHLVSLGRHRGLPLHFHLLSFASVDRTRYLLDSHGTGAVPLHFHLLSFVSVDRTRYLLDSHGMGPRPYIFIYVHLQVAFGPDERELTTNPCFSRLIPILFSLGPVRIDKHIQAGIGVDAIYFFAHRVGARNRCRSPRPSLGPVGNSK